MSRVPERLRRRTRTIALRVSDRELNVMHAGARVAGITLAELVRGSTTREARQLLRDERTSEQTVMNHDLDAVLVRRRRAGVDRS